MFLFTQMVGKHGNREKPRALTGDGGRNEVQFHQLLLTLPSAALDSWGSVCNPGHLLAFLPGRSAQNCSLPLFGFLLYPAHRVWIDAPASGLCGKPLAFQLLNLPDLSLPSWNLQGWPTFGQQPLPLPPPPASLPPPAISMLENTAPRLPFSMHTQVPF